MTCCAAAIDRDLMHLELLEPHGRLLLLRAAAMETGGYVKTPDPTNNWDDQTFEICAHGVYASGDDTSEAIRNWASAARSQSYALKRNAREQAAASQPTPPRAA